MPEPERVTIKINGKPVEAGAGKTILEVVRENQIDDIPTLCHSPELEPYASCFLCVVELKGRPNLVPACATRVSPGMEIETRSPRVVEARKTALELLLSNHYADCLSPCMEGCPAGVDAQGYIALSAMGLYREAVDLIRQTNPLPAVCGRVCVRKCEVVCRRADVDKAVGINAIKRFVTDAPGAYDGKPECAEPTGKTVAIVGAGPAGLTAAWFLACEGHKAVIYEAQPRSGGMLRYGIPTYRLPDAVIDAEVGYIERAGVEILCGKTVGRDISLDDLAKRYDAVFVGPGAWAAKPMGVEGEFATQGVISGTDFLREKTDDHSPLKGTVVVVGGGNTAMDVARTSWRLGADKVIILYRRTRAEMPADPMEIEDCLHEGVELMELAAPVGIVAEAGRLKALRCIRMKLGEPDSSGRRRPVPLEGSEFDLPCHLAVAAIGQNPVLEGLTQVSGKDLKLTRWKTIAVDTETFRTNVEGLFAGGDAVEDGPTVVIDAIRDGQKAARAIHAHLAGKSLAAAPFAVKKEFWAKPGEAELGQVKESPRHEVAMLDVDARRGNFDEVATGLPYEDNVHECDRCLACGCVRFHDCALRLYAQEYGVDMERYKGQARRHKVDDRHPYVVYDPNKCILCARCIRTCAKLLSIPALGLVGRGFRTEMRPALNDPLVETSCTSCGSCIDACPTGALTAKYPFPGRAPLKTDEVATRCGLCSLGCRIKVRRFGPDRYFVVPSGVPGEYLCRYGRFGYELFIKRKRIARPEVRRGSERCEPSLSEAQSAVAAEMKRVAAKYGPSSVAVFVSPELTNEELYLAARIAREGLGTNNIGSLSILATGRESGPLDASFGYTASTADRSCLRDADLIVCNNTSLESDHQVLAVEVIQAVKTGAGLVVTNSSLERIDKLISSLAMDPLRGTASVLWDAVTQVLLDQDFFTREKISDLPGADRFLADRDTAASGRAGSDRDLAGAADVTGVRQEDIRRAAELLRGAKRVVFIHSPDRPQDSSPGDMRTLANLVVLLRSVGVRADLLLPRITANSAALEPMGADPAFEPGRVPSRQALPGARSQAELRKLLEDGQLRAALIIGEDPMSSDETGSWFQNVEFMAAMDWTPTETTRSADVVLPGSTYLEERGTRCNFEGNLVRFSEAVPPASGSSGAEVLRGLATEFGIAVPRDLAAEVERIVGGERRSDAKASLVAAEAKARPMRVPPPLTAAERYKRELREVGTERFRVR
ncbi:MAG: FAD-dependent oxidoreductase [Candidatus Eisenbacteria bacterium]